MPSYIALLDYGMGNLASVQHAFKECGIPCRITSSPRSLLRSSGAVLPGVGAFGAAMNNLNQLGLKEPVREFISSGRPFLGVCLGLQLLFETSEESPGVKGLSVLRGKVVRFQLKKLKIPHIGWNTLIRTAKSPLLSGMKKEAYVYFVHSYHAVPENESDILTRTEYGKPFVSGVCRENIQAFQFHPEKSQNQGLKIYRNFGKLSFSI